MNPNAIPASLSERQNAPTTDDQVRRRLRELGEPVTYFGERNVERRERLWGLLQTPETGLLAENHSALEEEQEEEEEEFYTPGPSRLLQIRYDLLRYSLLRAKSAQAQKIHECLVPALTHLRSRRQMVERTRTFSIYGSQVLEETERATSVVRFGPDPGQRTIAAGSWDGRVSILNPDLSSLCTFRAHSEKVGDIGWLTSTRVITSGSDHLVKMWNLEAPTQPLAVFSGHTGRVVKMDIHPSLNLLASASHDTTWRLWDLHTETELYLQEGHSKELTNVKFNDTGALVASAGHDALPRVWDLRSGKSIMVLSGHIRPVHGLAWRPFQSHEVATGGEDGAIKIWDMRYVKQGDRVVDGSKCTIPGHTKVVSELRYFERSPAVAANVIKQTAELEGVEAEVSLETSGTFLVSSGYDGCVNVYSSDNYAKVRELRGHLDPKVMSCDVSGDGNWLVSLGWDRSVKLWSTLAS